MRRAATVTPLLLAAALALPAHEQEFGDPIPGTGHVGDPVVPVAGKVLDFAAHRVALLSWLTPQDLSGRVERANDVWGYVSPAGREYAIIGLESGTAFVEITDPLLPRLVGLIPGAESTWRDMAVYRDHAYSVNESGNGIQVIDLGRIDRGQIRLVREVRTDGLETAHNITVNEDSGYAYLSGSNLANGGLVALDLKDPSRPRLERGSWPFFYIHDLLAVTYDTRRHAGREIVYAFAAGAGLHIIDATDKDNMFTVAELRYPGLRYAHSGALSSNRKFLYLNDELDELNVRDQPGGVPVTNTYIFHVKNFERPRYLKRFSNGLLSTDHNSMVTGKRLFAANYTSGLRIFDIRVAKRPRESSFLDTYPEGDFPGFAGAWGVYSDLPSGNVLVSDIQRGLFVLRPQ